MTHYLVILQTKKLFKFKRRRKIENIFNVKYNINDIEDNIPLEIYLFINKSKKEDIKKIKEYDN
jgi:hypothetical protein